MVQKLNSLKNLFKKTVVQPNVPASGHNPPNSPPVNIDVRTESVSIIGLGGTGVRISYAVCNMKEPPIGIGAKVGLDLDSDWKPEGELHNYEWYLVGAHATPAQGVFTHPEAIFDSEFTADNISDMNENGVKKVVDVLSGPGLGDNIVFIIFSSSGGTGHGIFRSLSKRYDSKQGKEKLARIVVPFVVLPKDSEDIQLLCSSIGAFGTLFKNSINSIFPVKILVDNTILEKVTRVTNKEECNKYLAECIRVITTSIDLSIKQSDAVSAINRAILNLTVSRYPIITTIGYSSVRGYGDAYNSAQKAIKDALNNLLLKPIGSNDSRRAITFVIAPSRLDGSKIKKAIQDYFKQKGYMHNTIFFSQSPTYNIDVVVWVTGKFKPSFLEKINKLSKSELDGEINNKIQLFQREMNNHFPNKPNNKLVVNDAKTDIYEGIKVLNKYCGGSIDDGN